MPQLAVQETVAPSPFYGMDMAPTLSAVPAIDPLIEAARLLLWQHIPSNRRPRNPDLSIALEQYDVFDQHDMFEGRDRIAA